MHIVPLVSEIGDVERMCTVGCVGDVLFLHFIDSYSQPRVAVSDARQYAYYGTPAEYAFWALRNPHFEPLITSWCEHDDLLDIHVCYSGSETHNYTQMHPNGSILWDPHLPHRFVVLPSYTTIWNDLWLRPVGNVT